MVVAAQFHVMGSLQQLLRHLQQHRVLLFLKLTLKFKIVSSR